MIFLDSYFQVNIFSWYCEHVWYRYQAIDDAYENKN